MSDAFGATLDAALQRIAPPGVTTGCRKIDAADLDVLTVAERVAIGRAVPKRQHEFATGRALLRKLIGMPVDIPMRPDRSPLLPRGIIASLAHDESFAIAAVSTDAELAALGLDIEPADPLEPDIAAVVVRADEHDIDAHLAFTIKEAVYKAWSMAGGRFLEHHDVRLVAHGGGFTADVLGEGWQIVGRYVEVEGYWVALAALSHTPQGRG